jgi:ABC-type lipoprotein export system ATPase subunit
MQYSRVKGINMFERGSEWRQWDLHIHTPASFHWTGKRFEVDQNSDANRMLVDEMIAALNRAEPQVFALMDYWTFDGWFALRRRLLEPGAPALSKTVFPGIELRLAAPTKCRLNAHVLFSDQISDQELSDFKAGLNVEIIDRPLSDSCLMQLARVVGADKLKGHGIDKAVVDADDGAALDAGSTIAEINCDSYRNAIDRVPNGWAIGFMPYDTSDGLSEVKWQDHYAYFLKLFRDSPIFESRNADLRGAFVNEETPANAKFIKSFQAGLGNVSRLVVSGSDAHRFIGAPGDNDKRGYGDFPSGKATWIKADPTFYGLLQAIMEPAKRSFIGIRPPKLIEVESNKMFFIDKVGIQKIGTAGDDVETWLDETELVLNTDLVAIIGNKGSGKSALADVLALLGNTRQKKHLSFLKKDRFRGKTGEPAKYFVGHLTWRNGTLEKRNLNEDPPSDKVEMVRYIPQGHFEDLCNDHVSGKTNAFEGELRSVIFSHADESIRLGSLDFDQLVEQQEGNYRDQLVEFRKDLRRINQEIANIEEQLQPTVRSALLERLALKRAQIDEHIALKPSTVDKPSDAMSTEQQAVTTKLDSISAQLKAVEEANTSNATKSAELSAKAKAIQNTRERIRLVERAFKQFHDEAGKDLETLGLDPSSLLTVNIDTTALDILSSEIPKRLNDLATSNQGLANSKEKLVGSLADLNTKLNAPQLLHQQHLISLEIWTTKLGNLTGSADAPDTLNGLQTRLSQLDELPDRYHQRCTRRELISGEIFDVLNKQRESRELLFKPVQDLIQSNRLIRDEYKLQFQASLGCAPDSISSSLFMQIKQNSGEFRGEEESFATVRRLAEQHDFNRRTDTLAFVTKLHAKISIAAASNAKESVGIGSLLRKDRAAADVYDLIFGLTFLDPRYSLLFQDAQIEQLSPGQRGALLLIFYLLVDKGRNPIILDQPEENLDNETVVSLLVPVLTEAKRRRQVIMVTHNPNLAVVCDAEQVIWSVFDRKAGSNITYVAGSIENTTLNGHVVNVLEGTKPAFNNRRIKYH